MNFDLNQLSFEKVILKKSNILPAFKQIKINRPCVGTTLKRANLWNTAKCTYLFGIPMNLKVKIVTLFTGLQTRKWASNCSAVEL